MLCRPRLTVTSHCMLVHTFLLMLLLGDTQLACKPASIQGKAMPCPSSTAWCTRASLMHAVLHMQIYFPTVYDIKYLMKFCDNLHGGLNKLAEVLQVERIGPQHQVLPCTDFPNVPAHALQPLTVALCLPVYGPALLASISTGLGLQTAACCVRSFSQHSEVMKHEKAGRQFLAFTGHAGSYLTCMPVLRIICCHLLCQHCNVLSANPITVFKLSALCCQWNV